MNTIYCQKLRLFLILTIAYVGNISYSQLHLNIKSCDLQFSEQNNLSRTMYGSSVSDVGDINGDGYDDFIVGAFGTGSLIGRVYIYFGGAPMDNLPDLILLGKESGGYYASNLSSAGDVNGDGYNDVVIGEYRYKNNLGRIYIYFGGVDMDNTPDIIIEGVLQDFYDSEYFISGGNNWGWYNDYRFGKNVLSPGDVNNDGYNDVIVSAPGYRKDMGRTYIYYGGHEMDSKADVIINGLGELSGAGDVNNDDFDDIIIGKNIFCGSNIMDSICDITLEGRIIVSAGDVNNDGYDDIIQGDHRYNKDGYNDYSGHVFIYYGGSEMDTIPDVTINGQSPNFGLGKNVSSAGDVNNDGYDDILVEAFHYDNSPRMERLYIYLGGAEMDTIPDFTIEKNTTSYASRFSLSDAGDLNDDNFGDIIIGDKLSAEVYVYFGNETLNNTIDLTMFGEGSGNKFGSSHSLSGDVNNDGIKDVVIGAQSYNDLTGRAYVYFGGTDINNDADLVLQADENDSRFGISVSASGDINGDSIHDIAVGAYMHNRYSGKVYVYYGGSNIDSIADIILPCINKQSNFGLDVSIDADLNNDGINDIVVGAPGRRSVEGRTYIYFGRSELDTIPDIILSGEKEDDSFGENVSYAGDLNNDGYDDLIVGAKGKYSRVIGRVYAYFGGSEMDSIADVILQADAKGNYFGSSISNTGDLNNDGYDDIIVGEYMHNGNQGRAFIYLGNNEMDSIADITFYGKDYGSNFGQIVSSVGDINNDNFDDIAIHSDGTNYVYLGGEILDTIPDLIMDGNSKVSYGDVNNSGSDDFLLSNIWHSLNGAAFLHFGEDLVLFNKHPENATICELDTIMLVSSALNESVFQWQVSSDAEQTFSDITDNETYSGCLSANLQIIANNHLSGNYYRCEAENNYHSSFSQSALLSVLDKPSASIKGGGTICYGDSAKIEIDLYGEYPWNFMFSNGEHTINLVSNDSIFITYVDSTGFYRITSLNDKNCTGTEFTGEVIVNINPLPTVNLEGDSAICEGDSAELIMNFTGAPPWYYTLTDRSEDFDLIAMNNPESISVYSQGTYSILSLRDTNCIGTELTGEVHVETCTSVDELLKNRIAVYPNPNNGTFRINNLQNIIKIEIVDLNGQVVYSDIVNSSNVVVKMLENIHGVYIIKLIGNYKSFTNKIVIW